ncbi:MAG TPA: ABC transporter ATP-binding protein [Hyphomonas atlantica]|uniref:ABC transporter ATP-binding protein n=1 Tax=Hyphomonas atlantica TaxID=1280948 RepID=A0A3B9KYE2_9PROT|nr:ABC transporter ATP-binding protein [Hyphomonas atlantica]HAE93732.1 ABC transporter ATP-binding protein [Hyphomonas atlantica]
MTELTVKNVSVHADKSMLVDDASFALARGEFVALLGPNGAGKTSLIRAAMGLQDVSAGQRLLGGADVTTLSPAERARQIAYLPQIRPLAWPNSVRDVVSLGRFSHGAPLGRLKGLDAEAVDRALQACGLSDLATRKTNTLSGGELARVHCARAFAAEAPLLIADEPIAALDPRQQFRILDLIKSYVDHGGGALVVLHDIQLAARYASRMIWMKDGKIVADGPPADTLTPDRLKDIYGVTARIEGTQIFIEGAV